MELNITEPQVREKVAEVQRRLCEIYGCPISYFSRKDPLSELVSALLSHRTKNAASGRAFKQLWAKFGSWEAVRDEDVALIERAITPCTWPEQKAPRIKQVLQAVSDQCGRLSLDHLAELPVPEARAWLEAISGVGPKTSAAVLSFSTLRRRALPVDSHHHRVAVRLGLIGETAAVGPSHPILEAQLPAD
ncbi:Fe-S cluster assembly protein HesB [filamentous cyanobacterium CCP5]|nr:Fe-S cluster assembly protein HesB [filamentous cyanobacterium CCP5]